MKGAANCTAVRGLGNRKAGDGRFALSRIAQWVRGALGELASSAQDDRQRRRGSLRFESLEPRLLLSDTPLYTAELASSAVDLTIRTAMQNNAPVISVIDNTSGDTLATGSLTNLTAPLVIRGSNFDDHITLDIDPAILTSDLAGMVKVEGGGGNDQLTGPARDTSWNLTGANSGDVAGVDFSDIENLIGAGADDNFTVSDGASLSGQIDGGAGTNALIAPDTANVWQITGPDAGNLNGLAFVQVGNLIGGTADDTFVVSPSGSVSGKVDGGPDDGTLTPLDSLDYSALSTAVSVDLAAGSATGIQQFTRIDQIKAGSNTGDSIAGPADSHVTWTVTGVGAVSVDGIAFSGFENLTGAADNSDVFIFQAAGSISGTVDGGSGGEDGLMFNDPGDPASGTAFNPAGADSAGTATLYGKSVDYAGMDRQELLTGDDANRVVKGTIFNDTMVVQDADPLNPGQMEVSFQGLGYFDVLTGTFSDSLTFADPSNSLTVEGLLGHDNITVQSLDSAFAADLLLYGDEGGAPPVVWDPDTDSITFAGSISTGGGYLEAFAEDISVAPGVTLSTRGTDGVANDITFRARRFGTAELENLSPVLGTDRQVSLDIGAGAVLDANSIYLIAQAEDRTFSSLIGADRLLDKFLISPLASKVANLTAMPVKVLAKQSEASIVVGEGAQLLGDGTVGIYATASADASGNAFGSLFSVGYAQGQTTATVDIQSDVVIDAGDAVVVTSNAESTANMETKTEHSPESTPNPGSNQAGLALGVAYANATSHVTVASGASITAGKTANIGASGNVDAEAVTESGLFANGRAALAFGL
jgi:hypothetical protein